MAEIDNTTSGIVWQWLAEHRQDVLDYFASIMREASDIQLVNFDTDRHMGLLATFIYQGVRRIDNVKPSSLVEGLTRLNEDLRIRCENAAAEAERQGTYAKTQGDRVDSGILELTDLKEKVTQQGNTAEQQGANAQSICDTVTGWYTPFKKDAEDWLADSKADWGDWLPKTQDEWDVLYAAIVRLWKDWYTDGIVPDWNDFWEGVQADWQDWTKKESERQANEKTRSDNEDARKEAEKERQASEKTRSDNESARQKTEQKRVENENERIENEKTRQGAEQKRQQDFEDGEAARQQTFETNEQERIDTMLLTHFYVDDNMHLIAVQVPRDQTEYKVNDDSHLIIRFPARKVS